MTKLYHLLGSIVWICLPFMSYAQVDLEVSVSDLSNGQGLNNITVLLENTSIGYQKELQTNNQGKVRFKALAISGGYIASVAEGENYYAAKSDLIDLRANTDASVHLFLPKKTELSLDEVVIGGNYSVQINTLNAEVSSQLSQKEIEQIPVEGRDVTRLLFRLPNVSQATGFFPEAPNVAINGSNSLFTNYLIDGMDNNERFLGGQKFAMPIGFVKNITVLTNNFSAEYGLTGNGVINLTTRSGRNDLHGEVFFVSRPGPALDASSPFAQRDLSGNQVRDGFQRYQFGFGLGGALIKDRTFFYLNFENTYDLKDNLLNVAPLNVNETVRGQNRFTYLSAKIDHRWNDRFRSSLRVNSGWVGIERQGGGLEGGVTFPSAANTQDRNSLLIALKNVYNLNPNLVWESNYQYARFRWDYAEPDNLNAPQVTVLDSTSQTLAVLGHPGFIFDQLENTHQIQEKLTYYLPKHTLKAGFEWIGAEHELFGGGNPNGNYTVQLSSAQQLALQAQNLGSGLGINDIPADVAVLNYSVELRPQAFGQTQNIFSAYIEDEFSVSNRLNISLGLRYDYDNLSKEGDGEGDFNNLAPRFSFNYRISKRSSIRGGYGLFYDKILYAVVSDALQQNTTGSDYRAQLQQLIDLGILPTDTDLDWITFDGNLTASAADPSTVVYLNGPRPEDLQSERNNIFSNERRILNPNGYDNPYTHQFSLGYQYQINDQVLFYVDLVHNQSYNLFRLRDLNAPSSFQISDPNTEEARSVADADATRSIPINPDGTATINGQTFGGISRNIVVSETAGRARYYAVSLNLQKARGEDKFAYRLIYTLSRLEN
ncbi:MAG: TonB-dependent receptor, partial [Bacteroidota bacterium]